MASDDSAPGDLSAPRGERLPERREVRPSLRAGALRPRVLVAGAGPPLAYLHSFHGPEPWPPAIEALAGQFTVHVPAHPGFAGTDGLEAIDDVVDLALYYDELLEALGIDRADLVGQFFGGLVAAEVAALAPRRVRKLVLVAPTGVWLDEAPVPDFFAMPEEELRPLLWADPESPAARAAAPDPGTPEARAAAQLERVRNLAAVGKFLWPIPDKGLRKRAHRISAPTLLLWGDLDRLNPPAYAHAFARLIRGATLTTLAAGHMVLWEQPQACVRHITRFLGEGPG
jgi:pimeloyl-ACP methyl ester carboxylesterase